MKNEQETKLIKCKKQKRINEIKRIKYDCLNKK